MPNRPGEDGQERQTEHSPIGEKEYKDLPDDVVIDLKAIGNTSPYCLIRSWIKSLKDPGEPGKDRIRAVIREYANGARKIRQQTENAMLAGPSFCGGRNESSRDQLYPDNAMLLSELGMSDPEVSDPQLECL